MSVEWPSVEGSTHRITERPHILSLACYCHKSASSCVKLLGGRQGDGEEGVRGAEHFEPSI